MSKFRKKKEATKQAIERKATREELAFKSVKISTILGMIFLLISFLFNSGIVKIFEDQEFILNLIGIIIKTTTILLFFLFMVVSLANYMELIGKGFDWKYLLILLFLSLIQSFRDIWVFLASLIGALLLIAYLYVIQEG